MAKSLLMRLGATVVLFMALPSLVERWATYFQISPVFEGILAIVACFGACLPLLTIFQNSD